MYNYQQSPYMYGAQPQFSYQPQPQPQIQSQSLYGKYVDGIDVVRGIDVPIGTTGFYPTASGEKIFTKSWNLDGTTKIDEYQKITSNNIPNSNDTILMRLEELSNKIDSLQKPTTKKRKVEVDEDDE